jgi:hypothetical protein
MFCVLAMCEFRQNVSITDQTLCNMQIIRERIKIRGVQLDSNWTIYILQRKAVRPSRFA